LLKNWQKNEKNWQKNAKNWQKKIKINNKKKEIEKNTIFALERWKIEIRKNTQNAKIK